MNNLQNNAATIIQTSVKKYIERKSTLFFFDNDSTNFINCPEHIVLIKCPETQSTIFLKLTTQNKIDNSPSVLRLYENYLHNHVEWFINNDGAIGGFFDIESGIEKHSLFQLNSIIYKRNDKIIIDFDRTISITEGFLGNGNSTTQLAELFVTYKKFGFTGSIDDIIKIHMGGNKRILVVTKILKYMIKRVGIHNIIVVTNNVLKTVISDFMQFLIGTTIQVVSTHDIKNTKSQYITKILLKNNLKDK